MKISFFIIFVIAISFLFIVNSCKTDVDVNAKWKDITIVYGLLNQDSVTKIKISKAFLGPGNNNTYARVFDSTNYNPSDLNVYLTEFNSGSYVRTIPLTDTLVNKQTGIFSTSQYIWQTKTKLKENDSINLVIFNKKSNKIVSAHTELIHGSGTDEFDIIFPQLFLPQYRNYISFVTDQPVQWFTVANAAAYQLVIRFHYTEYNKTTMLKSAKYVDWDLPIMPTVSLNSDVIMPASTPFFKASDLYVIIGSQVHIDPNVTRKPGKVDYFFYAAGADYYTYMLINEPSTSIVQEHPNISDIANGIGLFSCRYVKKITQVIGFDSYDTLINGYYTKGRFIDTNKTNFPTGKKR